MSRKFIVSHRLPFSASIEGGEIHLKASMGGLASGLLPLLDPGTVWLGWHGLTQKLTKAQTSRVEAAFGKRGCATLRLPMRAHHAFYNDISNGVFWPLYHNQTGKLPLTLPHWSDYQLINRVFADRIAELVRPGDTVWIHDYHLQLLPKMLREKKLGISIAFFLHIPFPPAEIFRTLPIRNEILEGILGADIVGFHTQGYVDHFRLAAEKIASYPRVADALLVEGRRVKVCAAPLGVDAKRWESFAAEPHGGSLVEAIEKMRVDRPDLQILFSVDRLDYTKGLPRKLLAMERLLEKYEDLRGRVTLIQIAPGTREELAAYNRYKIQVEQLISAINGRFGYPGYQPILYFASAFKAEELAQAYRKVNVMLVTPLMDGMNLVAKEFVASRADHDGVLVLSEFAGAVDELAEALTVNPYDIDATAKTMHEALQMPMEERQNRMKKLRDSISNFDARTWAARFFWGFKEPEIKVDVGLAKPIIQESQMSAIINELNPPLALFIDYDGTLFPIVRRPELARPDVSLMMLLRRLCQTPGLEVHIVSGRRFDELFHWFYRIPLHIHGEHGAISYNPITRERKLQLDPSQNQDILQRVHQLFESYKGQHQGLLVEKKVYSSVLHYRMMEMSAAEPLLETLKAQVCAMEGAESIEILAGKKNLEVRAKGVSKGHVIRNRLLQGDAVSCIAIGDDSTDEDMFAAIPEGGLTLRVGIGHSQAQYRLRDSSMVRDFLRLLAFRLGSEAKLAQPGLVMEVPAGSR